MTHILITILAIVTFGVGFTIGKKFGITETETKKVYGEGYHDGYSDAANNKFYK
jgi:hypothetical protein